MIRSALVLLCLLGCVGCGLQPETDDRRIVHSGDTAVIRHGKMPEIPIAASNADAHALAFAVEAEDLTKIQEMVRSHKAEFVSSGTRVRVTGESFNERKIQVIEGDHAGQTGWAPFEWFEFRRT